MPWSNKVLGQKKFNLVQEDSIVVDYKPQTFPLRTNVVSETYENEKRQGTDFVLSDVVKKISGIDEIERRAEEKDVEQKVLEKISGVQKNAYDEAYKLGHEDGRQAAFEAKLSELNQAVEDFKKITESLQNLKAQLVSQNETHIVKLIYHIASRIAYDHIQENPNLVLPVIEQAIEAAQADENVTVYVSPEQLKSMEDMQKLTSHDYTFLKTVKFMTSNDITTGGCVIETNYGEIDSRIEQRVKKIGDELLILTPRLKKIAG